MVTRAPIGPDTAHTVGWPRRIGGALSGAAVAVLDLNGDGAQDLAVGAPGRSSSGASSGEIAVFFGPLDDSYNWSQADLFYTGVSASDAAG